MRISRSPLSPRTLGALLCGLAATGCALDEAPAPPAADELAETQSPVVYGTDDRTDVYAHPDATLRARAQQATVALMSPSAINTGTNRRDNATSLWPAERASRLSGGPPAVCGSNLVARREMHAAVALPAVLVALRALRPLLAVTHDREPVARNPQTDQEFAGCLPSPVA